MEDKKDKGTSAKAYNDTNQVERYFNLVEGERLCSSVKSNRKAYMIKELAIIYPSVIALFACLVVVIGFPEHFSAATIERFLLVGIAIISVVVLTLGWFLVDMKYNKLVFWITNHRVICRDGIISSSIRSIPIEMISDIVIHQDPLSTFLGVSDLMLPTYGKTDYALHKHRTNVNYIPALEYANAIEIQKQLFNLRNKRRSQLNNILTREEFVT